MVLLVLIALFSALGTLLGGTAALLAYLGHRSVNQLQVVVDGRLDQLLATTRALGHTEGAAQEKADAAALNTPD